MRAPWPSGPCSSCSHPGHPLHRAVLQWILIQNTILVPTAASALSTCFFVQIDEQRLLHPNISRPPPHLQTHNTRNGEDTKGTLQVLFLCTIKRVVFIVDISNKYPTLSRPGSNKCNRVKGHGKIYANDVIKK